MEQLQDPKDASKNLNEADKMIQRVVNKVSSGFVLVVELNETLRMKGDSLIVNMDPRMVSYHMIESGYKHLDALFKEIEKRDGIKII